MFFFTHWWPCRPKPAIQDYTVCLKNIATFSIARALPLLSVVSIELKVLRIGISNERKKTGRVSAFCKILPFDFGQEQKWTTDLCQWFNPKKFVLFKNTNIQSIYCCKIIAELWRARRACWAPWVSKSTHPRKFGNHVTVHRPPARCPPVRPHHRATNVQSHTF